jgi:hypothetical protein
VASDRPRHRRAAVHLESILRTEGEVASRATPPLPAPCTRIHAPLFGTIRAEWVAPWDRSPQATASRYLEMLEEGAATVARVVDLLGTVCTYPTVVHCAAGRDRTGIVIACVLDLLDVADATIADDYALSDAVLDDGGQAHPDTIHCLLEMVRVRHGSTRALLVERGMSEQAADRLAGALLAR